jgi:hypothetical protein
VLSHPSDRLTITFRVACSLGFCSVTTRSLSSRDIYARLYLQPLFHAECPYYDLGVTAGRVLARIVPWGAAARSAGQDPGRRPPGLSGRRWRHPVRRATKEMIITRGLDVYRERWRWRLRGIRQWRKWQWRAFPISGGASGSPPGSCCGTGTVRRGRAHSARPYAAGRVQVPEAGTRPLDPIFGSDICRARRA